MTAEKNGETFNFIELLKAGVDRVVAAGIAAMIRKPQIFRIKELDFDFKRNQLGTGTGIFRMEQTAFLAHEIPDLLSPSGKSLAEGFRCDI